jgi:aspartate 1-decarboxylase
MRIDVLKSKLHRARVTGSSLDYEGSLTIAKDLMERAGVVDHEKILCGNLDNGNRFETYAIPGKRGSGEIVLNGAAARLGSVGDRLTIMSFASMEAGEAASWKPRCLVLGDNNCVIKETGV